MNNTNITKKLFICGIASIAVSAFGQSADFDANGTTVNVVDGTVIDTSYTYGILARNDGTATVGDNVVINLGDAANPKAQTTHAVVAGGSTTKFAIIHIGDNLNIIGYGIDATDLTGLRSSVPSAEIYVGNGLNIRLNGDNTNGAAAASAAKMDLGTNAYIQVGGVAVNVQNNAVMRGSQGTFIANGKGELSGIAMSVGVSDVIFTDSNFIGRQAGLKLAASGANAIDEGMTGSLVFNGGSIYASHGAAIASIKSSSTASVPYEINHDVTLKGGIYVHSGVGLLYENSNTDSSIGLGIVTITSEGSDTILEGRFNDSVSNVETFFSITDNSTWNSEGSSNIDHLNLDNANLGLTLTETGDAITVGEMTTNGSNNMTIDFSNDFLNEIMDGFLFDVDTAIIIGSGEKDNINYIIADKNNDGSTWDVTDNLDGTYTISNINVVPEPGTYAAIFGTLALLIAVYKRRK